MKSNHGLKDSRCTGIYLLLCGRYCGKCIEIPETRPKEMIGRLCKTENPRERRWMAQ